MAATFFELNKQQYKQHGYPRRGGGFTAPQITLHTYEAPHTRSLLAAATWLTQRTTPGSYHALAGDDHEQDVLQLAPWSHETWHSVPSNNWSIGISAVAYAHQWNDIPAESRNNLVKSMAFAAANAADWLEVVHGRIVEPRFLNRAQAMRKESGFVTHAVMDPGRRSDPGKPFPADLFLSHFIALRAGEPLPPAPAEPLPPAPADPPPSGRDAWPYVQLPVTDQHTDASHNAWVKLLTGVEKLNPGEKLTVGIQRWLGGLGYYKGKLDGKWGPWTTDALQRFLRSKGLYTGLLDAFTAPYSIARGPQLVRAEISYLNDQAKYFK